MAQTPSRRRLLSAAAPALLAAFEGRPAHAEPERSDPVWDAAVDAELIAMCDRILESRAELERLYSGPGSPDDPDNHPIIGPRLDALDAVEDELMPLLAGMRAGTWACAEAMARVAYIFAERDSEGLVDEAGREWPGLAAVEWLVGNDFYNWATGRPGSRSDTIPPPRWRSEPPALPTAAIVAPDADAELIRLCEIYTANLHAYQSRQDERDSNEHPLWPEYSKSFEAMEDHPPAQTMAGVLALARLAKVEAIMAGREVWEGPAVEWAVDALNDLLRIYGEPVA